MRLMYLLVHNFSMYLEMEVQQLPGSLAPV